MIISVVMCEGPHDIAFVSKILGANAYDNYRDAIKNMPTPLNQLVENEVKSTEIGAEHKIRSDESFSYVPIEVMQNSNKFVLFYKMGGVNCGDRIVKLVQDYVTLTESFDFDNPNGIEGIEFSLFFDADDKGIDKRLQEINDNIYIPITDNSIKLEQGKRVSLDVRKLSSKTDTSFSIGAYIFHAKNEEKGDLEDTLLALMRTNNSKVFDAAEQFLKDNKLSDERHKEYKVQIDKHQGSKKYRHKKSVISVAGQLQISGMSNQVIIEKTDYILKSDILSSTECQLIYELINT